MYLMVLLPFCDVRYDFRIKTMFSSSLPTVVCRRAHVLFTLFALFANIGVQDILCVVLVLLSLSCVPYVASFSGLSMYDCTLGIL
jgi:hypothetical protein